MDRGANSSSETDITSDRFCTQFNSTALGSLEESLDPCSSNVNKKPDLKLSPILNDSVVERRTVFSKRMVQYRSRGESPLVKSSNLESHHILDDISEIHYEKEDSSNLQSSNQTFETSQANKENDRPGTSTPEREQSNTTTNRFSRSTNSFESRLLETLHTNTFSPSVFAITGTPPTPEEFKWSIEELSLLKPVHITQEEIAQSAYSPDPEQEAKIQSILDEYWKNNTCYIPSPDVPVKNPLLASAHETPLCDAVRVSAAMRMKYSTSSPKARPNAGNISRRASFIQPCRNKQSQTELTIAPSVDFDFAQFLGPSCVYNSSEEFDEESVFNATASSAGSLRRRLFSDDFDRDVPNCGSPTNLDKDDEDLLDDSCQSMIRCDFDGRLNSFDGFDVELSPIKSS
ncbi:hypothetical protein Q1695_005321 [Nippostrongylus brasiliensis]|nr:hypothetical protein Q1695_005321 [Nippostrongylus brasiliensis]